MKKTILTLTISLLSGVVCFAQKDGKEWQLEASIGANYPLYSMSTANGEAVKRAPFLKFGIEYRHQLSDSKFWIGGATTM